MKWLKSRIFLVFFILALVLALFFLDMKFRRIQSFVYNIMSPFSAGTIFLTNWIKDLGQLIIFPVKFVEESRVLEQEARKNLNAEAQVQELIKENKFLREALEIKQRDKFSLRVGHVIGRNLAGNELFLIIDQGLEQDIREGQVSISEEGLLIGVIDKAFNNSGIVKLIIDSDIKIAARVKNFSGIARGENNNRIKFDIVPNNESIDVGEMVVTTGANGQFPSGLLMGFVEKINTQEAEPLQQVFIKPAVEFGEINRVLVIIK